MAAKDRELFALFETTAGSEDRKRMPAALESYLAAPGAVERAQEAYALVDAEPVDLRVPATAVAAVRRELRTAYEKREDELDLVVGAQTNVTLELAEPVEHLTFFGRRKPVRVVRVHADDTDGLVRAFAVHVTRARTSPSPLPDPPA